MTKDRLFLDTAFIQALLNPRDDYHEQAKQLFPRIRTASEVWITEAIFAEVGNALSAFNRKGIAIALNLQLHLPLWRSPTFATAIWSGGMGLRSPQALRL
jgi:predicted nucleic acid-binding protein